MHLQSGYKKHIEMCVCVCVVKILNINTMLSVLQSNVNI